MKNLILNILLISVVFITCKKEEKSPGPIPKPSNGTADLNFRDRAFEFDRLRNTYILIIGGTLDSSDYLELYFKDISTEQIGQKSLSGEDVSGAFKNSQSIYAKYHLVEQDAFEDYVSLDSLNDEKTFYTLQLNMVDTANADTPDTLWITGTMEIKLPQAIFQCLKCRIFKAVFRSDFLGNMVTYDLNGKSYVVVGTTTWSQTGTTVSDIDSFPVTHYGQPGSYYKKDFTLHVNGNISNVTHTDMMISRFEVTNIDQSPGHLSHTGQWQAPWQGR